MATGDFVLIKVDAINSFNSFDRQTILEQVVARVPGLAQVLLAFYSALWFYGPGITRFLAKLAHNRANHLGYPCFPSPAIP